MRRTLCVWSMLALVGATAAVRAAETLRIVPLVRDNKVLVSFELADAYTAELREVIASGLETTFTYNLELRMVVPFWVDRTIATAVVSTSDQYDNLAKRHSLSRAVDGRIVDAVVTEDEQLVRLWLTRLNRLSLCETSKLEVNRDYYVRVTARARPQRGSLLGWATVIAGQAKFTFVP